MAYERSVYELVRLEIREEESSVGAAILKYIHTLVHDVCMHNIIYELNMHIMYSLASMLY